MNSSFLCVIATGLFFQVYAGDRFHSHLWYENLQKMKERERIGFVDLDGQTQMGEKNTKIYSLCAEKTNISVKQMSRIRKGDWKVRDPKARAWVKCVLMENDLMTEQSVLQLDVAFEGLSDLEKQLLEANIDKCLPKKAMPPVDISWEFAKCFQAVDPRNSLF